jgi:hypothetical protein
VTGVNDPICSCHDTKIGHLDDAMASRLPRDPTDPYSMRFFDRGLDLRLKAVDTTTEDQK